MKLSEYMEPESNITLNDIVIFKDEEYKVLMKSPNRVIFKDGSFYIYSICPIGENASVLDSKLVNGAQIKKKRG